MVLMIIEWRYLKIPYQMEFDDVGLLGGVTEVDVGELVWWCRRTGTGFGDHRYHYDSSRLYNGGNYLVSMHYR